jgi:hypothetical protein
MVITLKTLITNWLSMAGLHLLLRYNHFCFLSSFLALKGSIPSNTKKLFLKIGLVVIIALLVSDIDIYHETDPFI